MVQITDDRVVQNTKHKEKIQKWTMYNSLHFLLTTVCVSKSSADCRVYNVILKHDAILFYVTVLYYNMISNVT